MNCGKQKPICCTSKNVSTHFVIWTWSGRPFMKARARIQVTLGHDSHHKFSKYILQRENFYVCSIVVLSIAHFYRMYFLFFLFSLSLVSRSRSVSSESICTEDLKHEIEYTRNSVERLDRQVRRSNDKFYISWKSFCGFSCRTELNVWLESRIASCQWFPSYSIFQ